MNNETIYFMLDVIDDKEKQIRKRFKSNYYGSDKIADVVTYNSRMQHIRHAREWFQDMLKSRK